MPELPEVETVRQQIGAHLEGRTIAGMAVRPQRRFRHLQALHGATLGPLERHGKFLTAPLLPAGTLVVHLGMTGSLHLQQPDRHRRATLWFDDGTALHYRDVRRFGGLAVSFRHDRSDVSPTLAQLGPDPTGPDFSAEVLAGQLAGTDRPIGDVLLDQRVVGGLGTIYASELLWQAGLSPARPTSTLDHDDVVRLVQQTAATLEAAIAAGGTTFRDYQQVDGSGGSYQEQLQVYGRAGAPCVRCGAALVVWDGARRLVTCRVCTF